MTAGFNGICIKLSAVFRINYIRMNSLFSITALTAFSAWNTGTLFTQQRRRQIFCKSFFTQSFFTVNQKRMGQASAFKHCFKSIKRKFISVNFIFHTFSNRSTSVTNIVAPPTDTSTGNAVYAPTPYDDADGTNCFLL